MVNPFKKLREIPDSAKTKIRSQGRELMRKKVSELIDNLAPELKTGDYNYYLVAMAISYVYAFYDEATAVRFIADFLSDRNRIANYWEKA